MFAVIILLIVLVIYIAKRVKLSEKTKERIVKLKASVFWNPMIRYYILNSLKLSMTGFVVFKGIDSDGLGDYVIAILLLIILNAMPIIFYRVLRQK